MHVRSVHHLTKGFTTTCVRGLPWRKAPTTELLVTREGRPANAFCLTSGLDPGRRWYSSYWGEYPTRLTEAVETRLKALQRRHEALSKSLSGGDDGVTFKDTRSLHEELHKLDPIVTRLVALASVHSELQGAASLATDHEEDGDLRAMAQAECQLLRDKAMELESALLVSMIPEDEDDHRGAMLEVRAGAGGDEAAIFAGELLDMYRAFAALQGWPFQVLERSEVRAGSGTAGLGLRSAVAALGAPGVFGQLKCESGVHRVQRVPLTESLGRVHTSTASVVVLPEVDEVHINILDKDVRVDTYRASGAGGQHVNVTNSAVRVTHLPTGLVATCQDGRSQIKNKESAMKVLCARVYERERSARTAAETAERRASIGSAERNERIRTYNFQQGRVTDHRVGLTEHNIAAFMSGERLHAFISAVQQQEQADRLAAILE